MGTYADISNDGKYYGRVHETVDGHDFFEVMGNAVKISEVYNDIETDRVEWSLSYDYMGKQKNLRMPRSVLGDTQKASVLAENGIDVTRRTYDTLMETLTSQEKGWGNGLGGNLPPTINVYRHLGWIELPRFGQCYRDVEMIGPQKAKYTGQFDVKKRGDYGRWKEMVINDVLGHTVLELVLVAALAAVVNGLIARCRTGENPIVHLNYSSGKGKSTAGYLAVSTAGKPFEGSVPDTGICGERVDLQSLYQSWGATDNAIVTSQAGNCGAVTVLNELGKSMSKNLTRLVYDLSEGSDKKRLNADYTSNVSERYTTVFISTGETSLLDRCQSKLEGLRIRVMELNQPITDSAEQADRIKNTCREHCGHAAPMLASYILDNGGLDFVLGKYDGWVQKLKDEAGDTPNGVRFHEKFSALFLTTAELSAKALGIPFHVDELHQFLLDYDKETGSSRNTSAGSYDCIIEQCRINAHKFYRKKGKGVMSNPMDMTASVPSNDCWGRISRVNYSFESKQVVEEFEVRPSIVDKLLHQNGYENKNTCIAEWEKAGVLVPGSDRPTRKRKIEAVNDSTKDVRAEEVYVFRVFDEDSTAPTGQVAVSLMEDIEDDA